MIFPFDAPAVAGIYDDEFTASVIDPVWTAKGTAILASTLDFASTLATDEAFNYSLAARKSWLLLQASSVHSAGSEAAGTVGVGFWRTIDLSAVTNAFFWARGGFTHRGPTVGLNTVYDGRIGMALHNTVSGAPGTAFVKCTLNAAQNAAAATEVLAQAWSSSTTAVYTSSTQVARPAFTLMGIQKRGTNYDMYAGADDGRWDWIATQTQATAMDKLYLWGTNAPNGATSGPGRMVGGFDFVRYQTGIVMP